MAHIRTRTEVYLINSDGTLNCPDCGQNKPFTNEFYPYANKKEGRLLKRCKVCQNERTKVYRKENPNYWIGTTGWFRRNQNQWKAYLEKTQKSNSNFKIYNIISPDNQIYIGVTGYPNPYKRFKVHINDFNAFKKGTREKGIEKLYESFEEWGVKQHQFVLVEDLGHKDKEVAYERERELIKQQISKGNSLNTIKTKANGAN